MQLVGVYLVFASLIVPALATTGIDGKRRLAYAYAIGIAGYVIGLVLSAVLDLPSGAMIVWTLAGCGIITRLLIARASVAQCRRHALPRRLELFPALRKCRASSSRTRIR